VQSQRFTDKVCLINGAASEIGTAVAARLEGEGAIVVGVDRERHALGRESIQADLTDEAQVNAIYAQVVDSQGRFDVIYNNMVRMGAGGGSALYVEVDSWRQINYGLDSTP
jgi:NAD(P)-dependent dehydrogenase (short-subunit alcohol dehydrogenase family)